MITADEIVSQLLEDLTQQRTITMVTYGDSWTYGSVAEGWYAARDAGLDSSLITGSWSLQLKADLLRMNPHVRFYNQGMPGGTSLIGNKEYDTRVASLHPDYLILNFGINDWKNGSTLADYTAAMDEMIRKAITAHCQVILWISGPLSAHSGETYGWSQPREDKDYLYAYAEFTTILHKLANQYKLPIADPAAEIEALWKAGTDISGWFYDNIHFKQEGHDLIMRSLVHLLKLNSDSNQTTQS